MSHHMRSLLISSHILSKLRKFQKICFLSMSSNTKKHTSFQNEEISKSVFISQSTDIFTNLALEDWLYQNFEFIKHHVMLLWIHSPCEKFSYHQNPWLGANCQRFMKQGVHLARINGRVGAIHHDDGNLNLTFFTPRERYNRRQNLEIISSALNREWGLRAEINRKEDIVIDGQYKVSGTASKLGWPNSYHHCTLLMDVIKNTHNEALQKYEKEIDTNATASTPSTVLNLSDVDPSITIPRLISSIGWEYLRTTPCTKQDGGWGQVAKQRGFQMINPTDDWFPGLDKIKKEFHSWDWRLEEYMPSLSTYKY